MSHSCYWTPPKKKKITRRRTTLHPLFYVNIYIRRVIWQNIWVDLYMAWLFLVGIAQTINPNVNCPGYYHRVIWKRFVREGHILCVLLVEVCNQRLLDVINVVRKSLCTREPLIRNGRYRLPHKEHLTLYTTTPLGFPTTQRAHFTL